MMLHRFYGGVHLQDEKVRIQRLASMELPQPPAQLILPMVMHAGAPCKPIVAVGDTVKTGQCVAMPDGGGAPIHAGVSGTVTAIEPRAHPNGDQVLSVVIENDKKSSRARPFTRANRADTLTGEQLIALIHDAGVVGMSSGTPVHSKLRAALGKAELLIINGAESDPYSAADHRLMLEHTKKVIGGARILMSILGAKKTIIGVEGNKVDAVTILQGLLPLRGGDIKVKTLRVRYPQGGEIQLVQRLTGRQIPPRGTPRGDPPYDLTSSGEVNSPCGNSPRRSEFTAALAADEGGTPLDVGCVVFNVATVAAVYDAVREGRPLTRRIVTISGDGVTGRHNFVVPIGTPLEHLLACAGGLHGGAVRVLTGGAMRGTAQTDLSVPILKNTAVVVALPAPRAASRRHSASACIRCGRCISGCPMRLEPLHLYAHTIHGHREALARLNLSDCIECGVCDYRCPAGLPLLQTLRAAKTQCTEEVQP